MQAIASSTSERMPTICDGSNWVNGNPKPVALVRIVNNRKIAVRPGIRWEPSMANMTMMPETIATRLMITWTIVKVAKLMPKIMMHSPCWTDANATTLSGKLPHWRIAAQACGGTSRPAAVMPESFAGLSQILAIEKFDQLRDHLAGRFFHQP